MNEIRFYININYLCLKILNTTNTKVTWYKKIKRNSLIKIRLRDFIRVGVRKKICDDFLKTIYKWNLLCEKNEGVVFGVSVRRPLAETLAAYVLLVHGPQHVHLVT